MLLEQCVMLAIFAATFIGLVVFQRQPERVFGFALLTTIACSFVSLEEFLQNAVNTGLVTLILLVICSFALERTSFLRRAASVLISGSSFKTYFRTLTSTALASAVMNNTAVVASLIAPIKNNPFINPGKLLLPLSYAAILGGTLTLVGTSTNLIVNTMVIEQGLPALSFFDFTLVGGVASVACLFVMVLQSRVLPLMTVEKENAKEYFLETTVEKDSSLVGRTIEENGLRNLESLFLVEIVRQGHLISPVAPDQIIETNDRLIFTGDIDKVLVLQQFDGLKSFAEKSGLLHENLTEVLIKPDAAIVGKSLKSAGFRARFDAAVVAIRREGSRLSGKLGEIVIQPGDFFVLAVGNDFSARTNLSKNFYVLSGVQPKNMLSGWRDKFALFGFVASIGLTIVLSKPLMLGLMFYLAVLLVTGCLSANEIKRRFPIEIWLIVVSALSLANGLENVGIAELIAQGVGDSLVSYGPFWALAGIFIVTLIVTELMTNNAAAALIFPIAYSVAIGLGVNPVPFVMAVAFAASGSFISPYGYQTNVMVFNAANYQLSDFVKFGVPISIVYALVVITLIPKVFPF